MAKIVQIKKGLDIPLAGAASGRITVDSKTKLFGIIPDDYPGYTWKACVKAGDIVKTGTPLLHAKEDESISLASPVAGTVVEIHRGERRKIEFISVEKSDVQSFEQFPIYESPENILEVLKKSGLYALMRQRPFDIVPKTGIKPRDIFITAFDTAPLAPSMLSEDVLHFLDKGIETLSLLTEGKVYLSVPKGSGITSDIAEVTEFEGPHPAGNVGVQIAAIKPVNKGETVWTLNAVCASRIGKLFTTGTADYSATVAVTGPDAANPHLIETSAGAALATLLDGEIARTDKNIRIISGNVLTGYRADLKTGFLRYPYRQITLIDEGDDADEFMGWASMNPKKYSVKHTFPAFLRGLTKPFDFDARIKGGHRAMILSGEYDKVFPFDIYPEYLIKAILAKDIDKMEQLGIYEVAPEDFALPEFVDTSKLELQKIVRDGLDYLNGEL